jgi:hypothetical protein
MKSATPVLNVASEPIARVRLLSPVNNADRPAENFGSARSLSASARLVPRPINGFDSVVVREPRSMESARAIECA